LSDGQRSRVEASESLAKRTRDEARVEELSAEQARGDALDKAGRTVDGALKALAGERARVEAARATLAGLRGDLATEQERYAAEQRATLEEYERIARLLHEGALGSAEADRMYADIVDRLSQYRDRMRVAFSEARGPDRVAPFRARVDLEDLSVLPRGTEALVRSLVDRSDGVPRVALRYWANSLYDATENTVMVRTTPVPTADALELLPVRSRFVLAALLLHDDLSVAEAARVTRYSPTECEIALERLRFQGVLDSYAQRYRVSPFWDRAVVRFLRRKHLLYS